MTIKIQKYLKSTLATDGDVVVTMASSSGMTISHYADAVKSTEATIPFTIEGTEKHVPFINDVEFPVVTRKRVSMVAVGPNEKVIKDIGEDVGKYDYTAKAPTRPLDLPPGFEELYKE